MQALTQSVSAADGAQSAPALWRTVLGVFKLRIGVIIALTAMAGISVQPGTGLSAAQVTAVFVAVLLASASAGAFNQYYEADLDRHMRRTRARAFAAGRLARHPRLASADRPAWSGRCGARMDGDQRRGRAVHVPRCLLLRRGLHGLAQAQDLVEHRHRRHGWQLRRARRRCRRGARTVAPGAGAGRHPLPVDTSAFLEPGDRLSRRLRRHRRADAAGGQGRRCDGEGDLRARRRARRTVVAAAAVGRGPVYLACAAAGGGWFIARAWRLLRCAVDRARRGSRFGRHWCNCRCCCWGAMLDAALRS